MLTKYARTSRRYSRVGETIDVLSGDRRVVPSRRKYDRLTDNILTAAEIIVLVFFCLVVYYR